MAIAYVTTTLVKGSGTTKNIAYPASIAAGDLLVLVVGDQVTPTQPTGWTSAGASVSVAGAEINVFTRIADGTETGNLTLANGGTNTNWCVSMSQFTGSFDGTSINSWATNIAGAGTSKATATPSSPAGSVTFAVGSGHKASGTATVTESVAYAEVADQSQGSMTAAAAYATGAAPGACTFTWSATQTDGMCTAIFYITEAAVAARNAPLLMCI